VLRAVGVKLDRVGLGYMPGDRPYSGLSLTHANAQIVTLGASLTARRRAASQTIF
jgi:hypothetical protein